MNWQIKNFRDLFSCFTNLLVCVIDTGPFKVQNINIVPWLLSVFGTPSQELIHNSIFATLFAEMLLSGTVFDIALHNPLKPIESDVYMHSGEIAR